MMSGVSRDELVAALPYARRYARALTGTQEGGDLLVGRALGKLPTDASDARAALYGAVSHAFAEDAAPGALPLIERQMLLLTTLEAVEPTAAAALLGLEEVPALDALARARATVKAMASADVLIIEDEPIIAMDIELLVRRSGHRVIGVASSEAQAVTIALSKRPTLILADVNLGRGGDGTKAVARILAATGDAKIPVIFVTAYPERLLTGAAVEPAFIVTKPFDPTALAVTTFQAVAGARPVA